MTDALYAIRHPKRGQAHRQFSHWATTSCMRDSARGAALFETLTERLPVEHTDPADRCKRCWGSL